MIAKLISRQFWSRWSSEICLGTFWLIRLTARSSSHGKGWRWGRAGGLSWWEQVRRHKWLRGVGVTGRWMLDGLDAVATLDGGETLRSIKVVLVLHHQSWAGCRGGQCQAWQVCGENGGKKGSVCCIHNHLLFGCEKPSLSCGANEPFLCYY